MRRTPRKGNSLTNVHKHIHALCCARGTSAHTEAPRLPKAILDATCLGCRGSGCLPNGVDLSQALEISGWGSGWVPAHSLMMDELDDDSSGKLPLRFIVDCFSGGQIV